MEFRNIGQRFLDFVRPFGTRSRIHAIQSRPRLVLQQANDSFGDRKSGQMRICMSGRNKRKPRAEKDKAHRNGKGIYKGDDSESKRGGNGGFGRDGGRGTEGILASDGQISECVSRFVQVNQIKIIGGLTAAAVGRFPPKVDKMSGALGYSKQ